MSSDFVKHLLPRLPPLSFLEYLNPLAMTSNNCSASHVGKKRYVEGDGWYN